MLLVGETYGRGDISILATSLVVILTDLQMDVPGIFLKYVASGTDRVKSDDIGKAITGILEDRGEDIMPTLAEQWIEQGLEKGLQQGLQEGLQKGLQKGKLQTAREAVIETLELRFGVVPRSIIKEIDKIEELTLLKILHKQGVTFESLDQFKEVLVVAMA